MKKGSGHGAISEFNFQLMLTARMMISSGLARNNHRKAQTIQGKMSILGKRVVGLKPSKYVH